MFQFLTRAILVVLVIAFHQMAMPKGLETTQVLGLLMCTTATYSVFGKMALSVVLQVRALVIITFLAMGNLMLRVYQVRVFLKRVELISLICPHSLRTKLH